MDGEVGADIDALSRQLADATRRAEILQRVVESIGSGLALEPLLTRIVESGGSRRRELREHRPGCRKSFDDP